MKLAISLKPEPKLLVLWVTTDCNLRCKYCYARGGEKPKYMSWQVAKRALDFMISHSKRFTVQFSGGEPLLNIDLIEKVVGYTQELKGLNIRYQVQTNATIIDLKMAMRLKHLNIGIGVSFDGPPDVNDNLRPFFDGKGSTTDTITGLQHLRTVGIRTGLTCVLSADNVKELPRLVELVSYLGNIEGITFDVLRPIGRSMNSGVKQADPESAAKYVRAALLKADEIAYYGGKKVKFREVEQIKHLFSTKKIRRHHCYFDTSQMLVVTPEGDVYPCPSLTDPEFYLGNIMDQNFDEELATNLRKAKRLIPYPDRCSTCPVRWICGGPCLAQVYAYRNSSDKINLTACAIKKAFIDYVVEKYKSTQLFTDKSANKNLSPGKDSRKEEICTMKEIQKLKKIF